MSERARYELMPGERYAGFWIRFVASVVDSILVSVIIGPIAGALYKKPDVTGALVTAAQSGDVSAVAVGLIGAFQPTSVGEFLLNAVLPAAAIVAFWIYRSATPGKMLTRTRIVDAATGGEPSTAQFIVRYLGYFVSVFGLFGGFFWVAVDRRKQGWHDKIAGTLVLRDRGTGN
ncbi:MAG TPA: RDD family protein [Gemmatimonadaceae bacterium]